MGIEADNDGEVLAAAAVRALNLDVWPFLVRAPRTGMQ